MKHLFLAFSLLFITVTASAADLLRIVVNAPGPRNISSLPIDLIPTIGVDKEEGVRLQILHTGGGAVAMKNMVTRIADLKGKVIGANTSTKASKTTSQQLAELLLKSDDVPLNSVRIVPAGQSWVEQSSLMISGQTDAVVGDEPFASRLLADNRVFFLAHLARPETVKEIKGATTATACSGDRPP
jgi:ABC-type nitrate/sulfonate/bicarbonate transport system substrate-binding protein